MVARSSSRKWFVGVWLGPLLTLAFVCAKAVIALAGALFLGADAGHLATPSAHAAASPEPGPARATAADAILARNPFDHEAGDLDLAPPAGAPATAALAIDPAHAPRCEGVTAQIITAFEEPDWSLADLSSREERGGHLVRRGSRVGRKVVHFIGPDRVWLREGAALCRVDLHDGGALDTNQGGPSVAPSPPGAAGLDVVLRKGIVRVSATEHEIDRGVVERILENPAELLRARVVPDNEGGKLVGLRLLGVRPDSLLGALGVESGDRLSSINGFELTTPEKIFEAYARLRTADKLNLAVVRQGKPMLLEYAIK